MREILIILDGLMEKSLQDKPLDKLILGNLDVDYSISTKDFSVEGKAIDSLNCIMNILGYSPDINDIGDRAFYEALSMGIKLKSDEVVLRCNIIKYSNDIISDFTGGKLPKDIKNIVTKIKHPGVELYHVDCYKNLLILKAKDFKDKPWKLYPPHFNIGENISSMIPKSESLRELIEISKIIFEENNLNDCMLWPWGVSNNIKLKAYKEMYNKNACIITGIDMVAGMGLALGMKAIIPNGCNGYEDTNLNGKLNAVIENINDFDLVIVHINGLDELAHKKSFSNKIKFLEKIKEELILPLINKVDNCEIKITCDHRTDSFKGTHEKGEVPIIKIFKKKYVDKKC